MDFRRSGQRLFMRVGPVSRSKFSTTEVFGAGVQSQHFSCAISAPFIVFFAVKKLEQFGRPGSRKGYESGAPCSRRLQVAKAGTFSASHFALRTFNLVLEFFGKLQLVLQNIFKPLVDPLHVPGRKPFNGRLDFLHVAHWFHCNAKRANDKRQPVSTLVLGRISPLSSLPARAGW